MGIKLQECLSYLQAMGFDREALTGAREELRHITQRANSALPAPSLMAPYAPTADDVDRAVRLAWNEAIEEACRVGAAEWASIHPTRTMERLAAMSVIDAIRALKRAT